MHAKKQQQEQQKPTVSKLEIRRKISQVDIQPVVYT